MIDFENIIAEIVHQLEETSTNNPTEITSCKSGEDFEVSVVNTINQIKAKNGYSFDIDYQKGSHRFPDIILLFQNGEKLGIEVKSSASSTDKGWKINGNSIVGSTKDSSVNETYIIFGKTQLLEFRYRPYSECVSDIAVTHSPRYKIDMDLGLNDNFFVKSGISYEDLSNADDPIKLITSYYREVGKQAWWIADEVPATIIDWKELESETRDECYAYIFAHFPEVFSEGSNKGKYIRTRSWLIATKSVIALRDIFTAGGQEKDITIGRKTYKNIPHVYSVLNAHKDAVLKLLSTADESLYEDWKFLDKNLRKPRNYKSSWISLTVRQMDARFLNGEDPKKFIEQIMR